MNRILIVDDHEIVRRGLEGLLEEAFPDAVFGLAACLARAQEQIRREIWDLVVLDISLPDGSGLDLIPELRALRPGTAILVLSTYRS